MNTTGYVLIGIAIIAAAIVVWLVSTSNEFRTMLVRIKEADSGIDVALTKRYDTLTKMMDVVRAYAKHGLQPEARRRVGISPRDRRGVPGAALERELPRARGRDSRRGGSSSGGETGVQHERLGVQSAPREISREPYRVRGALRRAALLRSGRHKARRRED